MIPQETKTVWLLYVMMRGTVYQPCWKQVKDLDKDNVDGKVDGLLFNSGLVT